MREGAERNRPLSYIIGLLRKKCGKVNLYYEEIQKMKSMLIKDTTREEREKIVHQALWGACGIDCEFCSGCDNRDGGRIESIYQPYIDGLKEIREINAEYNAPFVR